MNADQINYLRVKAEMQFAEGGPMDFASDRTRARVSCVRSRFVRVLRFAQHLEAVSWFAQRSILAGHGQPLDFPEPT